jgi:hypothetical protein
MKVLHNQSVLDFILQYQGSIAGALDFCFDSGISLTDDMVAGTDFTLSDKLISDTDILNYYTNNNYKPATATLIDTDFGIGEMAIGSTFIIR